MRIAVAILFSTMAWAQVTGPTLGWIPEGSRVVPMRGISGAAQIDDSATPTSGWTRITVSPRQDYALAVSLATGDLLHIVPGVSSTSIASAAANPSRIVMSPLGTAAALWFDTTSHFEILSGLPDSPAIRDIDATFLGAPPTAIAVSDDGQWLTGSWSSGVYAWAQDSSVRQIEADPDVQALAFLAQQSNLALATSARVFTIAGIAGNPVATTLYTGALSPAGLAATFDNSKLVLANASGIVYSFNLATGASSTFDCQCAPAGAFGTGASAFRLTSSTLGPVKLFDANAGAVFNVPRLTAGLQRSSASERPATSAAPLPTLSIGVSPATTGFDQQPTLSVGISSAYTSAVTGTVTLTFASSVGGDDQLIQFSTGGRTVNFTIPAGSTKATFTGASSVQVLTGTVAGTITLTATIPGEAVVAVITTNPSVPFISNVTFANIPGGVQVVVTGFSSTRDMVSGLFHFAPSSNETISGGGDVTVSLASPYATWYQSATSNAFGSEFTLTVPFNVQGSNNDVVAVTVTLTNSKGASNPVTPQ